MVLYYPEGFSSVGHEKSLGFVAPLQAPTAPLPCVSWAWSRTCGLFREREAGFGPSTLEVVKEQKKELWKPTVGGSEPVCSGACSPGHRHKDPP